MVRVRGSTWHFETTDAAQRDGALKDDRLRDTDICRRCQDDLHEIASLTLVNISLVLHKQAGDDINLFQSGLFLDAINYQNFPLCLSCEFFEKLLVTV